MQCIGSKEEFDIYFHNLEQAVGDWDGKLGGVEKGAVHKRLSFYSHLFLFQLQGAGKSSCQRIELVLDIQQ